ncbi:hypothetical protein O3M35_011033 [Rhynocoris fuscipes]|uniref:Protein Star n=1 Tax=Rhynocoris fuscipes TaxID=488301 RepID=A0AAW1CXF6_9HEMI
MDQFYIYVTQGGLYVLFLIYLSRWLVDNIYLKEHHNMTTYCSNHINSHSHKCLDHFLNSDSILDSDKDDLSEKLQMDDPSLVYNLRNTLIYSKNPQYIEISKYSKAQFRELFPLLVKSVSNKTNGFFIEFGAGDGIVNSLTLPLEQRFNWTGLLVEADPRFAAHLHRRGRKSLISSTCLGYQPTSFLGLFGINNYGKSKLLTEDWETYHTVEQMTCFPMYTYLLALNRTNIDLVIIDVNDKAVDYLTLPFDKVLIDVIMIKYLNYNDLAFLSNFMEQKNYETVGIKEKNSFIVFKKMK